MEVMIPLVAVLLIVTACSLVVLARRRKYLHLAVLPGFIALFAWAFAAKRHAYALASPTVEDQRWSLVADLVMAATPVAFFAVALMGCWYWLRARPA
jgi:hypothetical protein